MTIETLTVEQEGMTLDLLLYRRFGFETRLQVEETLIGNQDLAEQGLILALGTRVDVEVVAQVDAPPAVRVRRLWG